MAEISIKCLDADRNLVDWNFKKYFLSRRIYFSLFLPFYLDLFLTFVKFISHSSQPCVLSFPDCSELGFPVSLIGSVML
jgi:hypothetical protein